MNKQLYDDNLGVYGTNIWATTTTKLWYAYVLIVVNSPGFSSWAEAPWR
jgi:hypothetical protein